MTPDARAMAELQPRLPRGVHRVDGHRFAVRVRHDKRYVTAGPFETLSAAVRALAKTHRELAGAKGLVYFIQQGYDGPIKIGRCLGCPLARMRHLQIGNPTKLRLLALRIGGRSEEDDLHARFRDEQLIGEWFRPTADVLREAFGA